MGEACANRIDRRDCLEHLKGACRHQGLCVRVGLASVDRRVVAAGGQSEILFCTFHSPSSLTCGIGKTEFLWA